MSPESSVGGMSLAGDSVQQPQLLQPAPLQQQQAQQKARPGIPAAAARLPFDLSQPGPIEIDTSLLYDAPSTTGSHSGSTGDAGQADAESHPDWQPSQQKPGPSQQQGPGPRDGPGVRPQKGFNSRAGVMVEAGTVDRDVWALQQEPSSDGRSARPASAPRERPLPRVTIPE